jgi:hypothetical protein|tara:strand:+ start:96 stop:317 length:222 start_codon:yes stop_codon:yes gene_type:complete
MYKVGDLVEKVGGDYTFVGHVVSVFEKLSGAIRLVIEDDRGVLHVYNEKILRLVDHKPNGLVTRYRNGSNTRK